MLSLEPSNNSRAISPTARAATSVDSTKSDDDIPELVDSDINDDGWSEDDVPPALVFDSDDEDDGVAAGAPSPSKRARSNARPRTGMHACIDHA